MQDNKLLESLNLLYVEDCVTTLKTIKPFLEKFFKNVFVSLNGEDALKKYKKHIQDGIKIDVIITDINMPKLNGLELIFEAKKIDESIKTIVTSSNSNPESFVEAIKLKVDGYTVKPINISNLLNEIENIFQDKENKISSQTIYLEVMNKITLFSKMNTQGKLTYLNDCYSDILKYDTNELLDKDYSYIYADSVALNFKKELWITISNGQIWKGTIKCKNKEDQICFINTYIFPIYEKINKKNIIEYVMIGFQVTQEEERKREFKKNIFLKIKELNIKIYDLNRNNKQLQNDVFFEKKMNTKLENEKNMLIQQLHTNNNKIVDKQLRNKKLANSYKKHGSLLKLKYYQEFEKKESEILALQTKIEKLEKENRKLLRNVNESSFNLRLFYKNDRKFYETRQENKNLIPYTVS